MVIIVAEMIGNLLSVGRIRGTDLIPEEFGQVIQSIDDVDIRRVEVREVIDRGALFVEVGLVNEVPIALERIALALDVIGKSSTLSEWMLVFILCERCIILFQDRKFIKSCCEHIWVLILK